jgi:hypothetical protein
MEMTLPGWIRRELLRASGMPPLDGDFHPSTDPLHGFGGATDEQYKNAEPVMHSAQSTPAASRRQADLGSLAVFDFLARQVGHKDGLPCRSSLLVRSAVLLFLFERVKLTLHVGELYSKPFRVLLITSETLP